MTRAMYFGLALVMGMMGMLRAEDATLVLRTQTEFRPGSGEFERADVKMVWPMDETAVIVCDVWDYHHCLNAVRRLEEFTPKLNAFLIEARRRGATIIHAPSDCMPGYEDHAARKRTLAVPKPEKYPVGIEHWCSKIAREETATYPIDQSDGGEDDDAVEHATWAAKLKSLGRNPSMPWKMQSPAIEIDADRDFMSDRGDEVWNILEARGIRYVILTGVHANMCVLGRPFGLRQMARCGKEVVFLRDLSDSMYSPKRWPYVDHFTGHDLTVSHIERYVCPTISSDALLGGKAFRFQDDRRERYDVMEVAGDAPANTPEWALVQVPLGAKMAAREQPAWYRCAVQIPREWIGPDGVTLELKPGAEACQGWLNGHALRAEDGKLIVAADAILPDEANMLVLRVETVGALHPLTAAPRLTSGAKSLELKGRWQSRIGEDEAWRNIPLPAKFGAATDIFFGVRD